VSVVVTVLEVDLALDAIYWDSLECTGRIARSDASGEICYIGLYHYNLVSQWHWIAPDGSAGYAAAGDNTFAGTGHVEVADIGGGNISWAIYGDATLLSSGSYATDQIFDTAVITVAGTKAKCAEVRIWHGIGTVYPWDAAAEIADWTQVYYEGTAGVSGGFLIGNDGLYTALAQIFTYVQPQGQDAQQLPTFCVEHTPDGSWWLVVAKYEQVNQSYWSAYPTVTCYRRLYATDPWALWSTVEDTVKWARTGYVTGAVTGYTPFAAESLVQSLDGAFRLDLGEAAGFQIIYGAGSPTSYVTQDATRLALSRDFAKTFAFSDAAETGRVLHRAHVPHLEVPPALSVSGGNYYTTAGGALTGAAAPSRLVRGSVQFTQSGGVVADTPEAAVRYQLSSDLGTTFTTPSSISGHLCSLIREDGMAFRLVESASGVDCVVSAPENLGATVSTTQVWANNELTGRSRVKMLYGGDGLLAVFRLAAGESQLREYVSSDCGSTWIERTPFVF
jgi:hypothetical protein